MASEGGIALVDLDEQGVDRAFRADVLEGLGYRQKAIPARWLYDDAGSQLFEDITKVPEYYPTRAETEILTERAGEIARVRNEIGRGRAPGDAHERRFLLGENRARLAEIDLRLREAHARLLDARAALRAGLEAPFGDGELAIDQRHVVDPVPDDFAG